MSNEEKKITEAEGSEETAASVLTSLGAAAPRLDEEGDEDDEEEQGDFEIPQRFTKSGRKRAIPFPLKVSLVLSFRFNPLYLGMPAQSIRLHSLLTLLAFADSVADESSFQQKLQSHHNLDAQWKVFLHH